MKQKELDQLKRLIENNGLDYAIRHRSDYREIDDEMFHHYRSQYVAAAELLLKFLKIDEES